MPRPTTKQLQNQIGRAAAYINGENKARFFAMLDGAIVAATLQKWIANIDDVKVNKSSTRFYEKMLQIPDHDEFDAYEIYKSILREAKIGFSVQTLLPYAGLYHFGITQSNITNKGFSSIGIKVSADRSAYDGFAGFKFVYRSPILKKLNSNNTEVAKDFLSDGFVFCRGEKIYFIGTAEETTFLAYVTRTRSPDKTPLEGRMIFECSADNSFIDAEFSLIKRHLPANKSSTPARKKQE